MLVARYQPPTHCGLGVDTRPGIGLVVHRTIQSLCHTTFGHFCVVHKYMVLEFYYHFVCAKITSTFNVGWQTPMCIITVFPRWFLFTWFLNSNSCPCLHQLMMSKWCPSDQTGVVGGTRYLRLWKRTAVTLPVFHPEHRKDICTTSVFWCTWLPHTALSQLWLQSSIVCFSDIYHIHVGRSPRHGH